MRVYLDEGLSVTTQSQNPGNAPFDSNFFEHPDGYVRTPTFTVPQGGLQTDWGLGLIEAKEGAGTVWHDVDGDGIFLEEPTIAGATVHLLSEFGAILETTLSGEDGSYRFTPAYGSYEIEVLVEGFAPTLPNAIEDPADPDDSLDSDIGLDGRGAFILEPGSPRRQLDAGFVEDPLFADGFEDGDTSAWNATAP